jgi:hypothetical protein
MLVEKWNDIRVERDRVDTIPLGGYDDPPIPTSTGARLWQMRVDQACNYQALKEA